MLASEMSKARHCSLNQKASVSVLHMESTTTLGTRMVTATAAGVVSAGRRDVEWRQRWGRSLGSLGLVPDSASADGMANVSSGGVPATRAHHGCFTFQTPLSLSVGTCRTSSIVASVHQGVGQRRRPGHRDRNAGKPVATEMTWPLILPRSSKTSCSPFFNLGNGTHSADQLSICSW